MLNNNPIKIFSYNRKLAKQAENYAIEAHKNQSTIDGYHSYFFGHISPVTQVVERAIDFLPFFNENDATISICCAYLHDTIEDTAISYEDIKSNFGE